MINIKNISANKFGVGFEISFTLVHLGVEHDVKGEGSDFKALFEVLCKMVGGRCRGSNPAPALVDLEKRLKRKLGLIKPQKLRHFGPCS